MEKLEVATELVSFDKSCSNTARRSSLIALVIFLISQCATVFVFRYTEGSSYYEFVILISVKTLVFWWIVPLVIVYKIERRDVKSLGLKIPPGKLLPYALYALAALILPLAVVGYHTNYPMEFAEQLLYIGFSEEFFYRGFILTRLSQWLGKFQGLLAASFVFGLGHILSRLADQGVGYFFPAIYIGMQTFIGGLIFGYIYIRAKNIWPPSFLHVSTNMYLEDLISIFTP